MLAHPVLTCTGGAESVNNVRWKGTTWVGDEFQIVSSSGDVRGVSPEQLVGASDDDTLFLTTQNEIRTLAQVEARWQATYGDAPGQCEDRQGMSPRA